MRLWKKVSINQMKLGLTAAKQKQGPTVATASSSNTNNDNVVIYHLYYYYVIVIIISSSSSCSSGSSSSSKQLRGKTEERTPRVQVGAIQTFGEGRSTQAFDLHPFPYAIPLPSKRTEWIRSRRIRSSVLQPGTRLARRTSRATFCAHL